MDSPTVTYCDNIEYIKLVDSDDAASSLDNFNNKNKVSLVKPLDYATMLECSLHKEATNCLNGSVFGVSVNIIRQDYSKIVNHNDQVSLQPGISPACITVNLKASLSTTGEDVLSVGILPSVKGWGLVFVNIPGEPYYDAR